MKTAKTPKTTRTDLGIIFFHSYACAPCAEMLPLMRGWQRRLRKSIPVRVLDADTLSGKRLSDKYKIDAVPAYVVVLRGQAVVGIGLRDNREFALWFAKACVRIGKKLKKAKPS